MPKWTDYTIKTTVADNDEIMTLDTAGKANKRLSLSTLSDWVLGKIADKVFEKLQTNDKTILGAINELKSNTHLGTLNDNIAEYLSKTNGAATTYFVWGNIGGLYPSWAWGTLLCSNYNTANFIGIANSNKTAAFAHYENGAWEKVPVELLSNLTTTNKSSLVGAINELNSNTLASRGNITESLDNYKTTGGTHLPGVYLINGYDVFGDGKNKWGILILFQYINVQLMIIEGGNIYSRDWSGNPLHWTNWKIFSNSNME